MRPPYEAGTGSIHLVIICAANRIPGDEHQIPSGLDCVPAQSHRFAQAAFDAITHHSVPDPAADREAEATIGETVSQNAEDQQMIRKRSSMSANLLEPLAVAYSVLSLHTNKIGRLPA